MWAGPFFVDRSHNVATKGVEPTSGALQRFRGDVRVPFHHRAGLPAAEPLKFVRRCPGLPMLTGGVAEAKS